MIPKYAFTNILGTFYFDEHFNIIDSKMFKNFEDYKDFLSKDNQQKRFINGLNEWQIKKVLLSFKKKDFYRLFYERGMILARERIKNSVKEDTLIVHTVNNLLDVEQVTNTLVKDLREWYELYNPEFSRNIGEHKRFVDLIIKKSKDDLLESVGIKTKESMGADFQEKDLESIMNLANFVKQFYEFKEKHEKYLEGLMETLCPNLKAVAGAIIGARLIRHCGSLKKLMEMPSSKIQLLGAEKALFRHMKSGAKPPKFGIIFQHPLIQKAEKIRQGRIARALADKIGIAVKIDYFKGEFIGDKLYKSIEEKFYK